MQTKQQNEALKYFNDYASDWKRQSEERESDLVNVIKERNDYVLHVIEKRGDVNKTLDVACGTGDLVCEIAQKETIDAHGVDFAPGMIDLCKEKATSLGLKNASFECNSVFDYDMGTELYDVISANGFIEYISYQQLDIFFTKAQQALKKGGSLVFGSRNRLFNLMTSNRFTLSELNEGTYELLAREAIKIVTDNDLEALHTIQTAPLQKENHSHEYTGIEVDTRYQFTPAQLIQMLDKKGFSFASIGPCNVHGVPPVFGAKNERVHGSIANLLHPYAQNDLSLLPQASTFMLHVTKN